MEATELEAVAIVGMMETLIREGCRIQFTRGEMCEDGLEQIRHTYSVNVVYDSDGMAIGDGFSLVEAVASAYERVPEKATPSPWDDDESAAELPY